MLPRRLPRYLIEENSGSVTANDTFECRGPQDAQINCSEYVPLPDLLSVEMHVPDVTLRVNKPTTTTSYLQLIIDSFTNS